MRGILAISTIILVSCGGEPGDLGEPEREATSAVQADGTDFQFHPTFVPRNAAFGGFGGGVCVASRTPVVFVPGNGDAAKNWDYPSSTGVRSVYDEFRAAGYSDCELFGVNYLSVDERATGTASYHTAARARILADFITDVKRYTGKTQVDVVAHSLGVTVALEGLRQFGLRSSTRRFIAIAGGLRGLSSCYYAGYANPLLPVCGSANWFDSTVFGLYPHTWYAPNPRMGDGGLRDDPALASTTRFYSLSAGYNDQVACTTSTYYSGCAQTNRFDARSNVYAQLDVGAGSTAGQYDFDFSDWSPFALGAGDIDGVGHFRAKNDTGAIQVRMLTTACTGTACCTGYAGACR